MRILYLPNSYSQQRQHEKRANIYPVLLAMQAEWYRKQGHYVQWGSYWYPQEEEIDLFDKVITEPENLPFLTLPRPDRVFTRAKEYTSGNYKYLPGTHILSATGCIHGRCIFCCEQGLPYQVRPVEDVISEIEECKSLGFKEVFDDSATFPDGEWCEEFCKRVPQLVYGCNCRINSNCDFLLMLNSGFRMLLFGIESANQITLDRINKGVKVEDIVPTIKAASRAGLEPHIAVMFGYPWETRKDAERTLGLTHYLLRKGYAKTAQASLYCPPDGIRNETHKRYVKKIYEAGFYPDFWFNKLKSIRRPEDFYYIWRGIKAAFNK